MSSAAPAGVLLVDTRPLDHPTARNRGIGRYTAGLLGGLVAIDAPVIGLYGDDVEAGLARAAAPGLELQRWGPGIVREHLGLGTWYLATQLMLHPIPLDPIPSVVTAAGLPVAAVMYDVIPYRHPELYQREPSARAQARLRKPLAGTVDAMLAISRFSAETAAAELAFPLARMRVIGAGVEQRFVPSSTGAAPWPERMLPRDLGAYVVAVTGGDERKNTVGLLRAWAEVDPTVRRTTRLVIATGAATSILDGWRRVAAEARIEREVVFTGFVEDDEMVAILQRARLAVMPSVDEGFGLPVLEAAACGCPAVCSGTSSLPEVLDEPSAWFDPSDPKSMARAIERALCDDEHRSVLVKAGRRAVERFTWERTATATMAALTAIGPRWSRRLRPPPRRLAFAGPFEGSSSGIGRYDVAVVAALEELPAPPRIDLFVDGSGTPDPTGAGVHRLPVRALGRYAKPWDYDDIVAVLGSSPHHIATAELATTVPCHVWLHEASLVGVHVGLAHRSGSRDWGLAHVSAAAGASDRARLETVEESALIDAPLLDELGVTLLDSTVAAARSVIVSSDVAAGIVRSVRPDGPPILVLPHAHPPLQAAGGIPSGREIVAAGWLAANKAPLVAIEVLARLPSDVHLRFSGPADVDVTEDVRRAASAAGVGERVEITGWLDDAAYGAGLARARVGLQLRRDDRGEMSGAIADLLAHRIPTVTTLTTAGPPSAGLQIVSLDVDQLVAAIGPLLDDDELWTRASSDAADRAAAWTFDDVATALLAWFDDVGDLDPGTVRRLAARAT